MRPEYIPSILDSTKSILERVLEDAQASADSVVAVDGTVGNGHDTLFLASWVGQGGRVFGFEVQASGLAAALQRLENAHVAERATLVHAGHETLGEHIPLEYQGSVAVGMYNLGYLPGSDKETITRARTTIASLEALMPMLRQHGVITVHIYTGHEGGTEEGSGVLEWSRHLDWKEWRVARYDFTNKQHNKETLLIIERLSSPSPL